MPRKSPLFVGLAVMVAALFAACGPTHATVPDALAGTPGEGVDLPAVRIEGQIDVLQRETLRNLRSFMVCDEEDRCIRVDVINPNFELRDGLVIRVNGRLVDEPGIGIMIRGNFVSQVRTE